MLYVRMSLSIVVSLYTSRVVLQTLGVDDFGIYGVVGGVVGMFSFLNSAMSGATSRFLTFEMGLDYSNHGSENSPIHSGSGQNGFSRLQNTFSTALVIHIGIALIVFLLSVTVGLWFLNNRLVIPEGRMTAAYWVFVCSILGMFVSVTQVPYNAVIIAHEKMDIYAYVELLNVFLKLGIVFLLRIGNFDKLKFYVVLLLCVGVTIALIYRIYCLKHYEETHFHWVIDKPTIKSITSFSVYNLLGNFGSVFNLQGINFLINMFFGVALNAAASIASTVSGVVEGFISNVITAFRPPITKAYAQNDIPSVERLLKLAMMISIIVNSLFAVPLLLELDTVLQIWLGIVPKFAATFCRVILISIFFETIRYILIIGIHAVGNIRNVSLVSGSLFILNPFVIYLCLKLGIGPEVIYVGNVFVNALLVIWNAILLHRFIPGLNVERVLSVIVVPTIISILTLIATLYSTRNLSAGFIRVVITTAISCSVILGLNYLLCLDKTQRNALNIRIKKVFRRQ